MNDAPKTRNGKVTKAELERLQGLAAGLKPGAQVSVGNGIQLRVDGAGRLRFQLRLRVGGAGSRVIANTFASYEEALAERGRLLKLKNEGAKLEREGLRGATFEHVAGKWWHEHVLTQLAPLTQLSYGGPLENRVLVYFQGRTLASLTRQDGRDFIEWMRGPEAAPGRPQKPAVGKAAGDRALAVAKRVINYAIAEGYTEDNPFAGLSYRPRKEIAAQRNQPVLNSDLPSPETVEQIRAHVTGRGVCERVHRTLFGVLAYVGMRPGEALALRHSDWRKADGTPKRLIRVDNAVKDLGGFIEFGETKTRRRRDVLLWQAIAEELEQLYQAEGQPPLDSYVFAGESMMPVRWDNVRHRVWYDALFAAGVSTGKKAAASNRGAFVPYTLRHFCASLMICASKPDGGSYTVLEVARQLGHSPEITLRYYADLLPDDGIVGKTMDEVIRNARGW